MDIEEKISGIIWGMIIGDALGLAGEFLTKNDIQSHYGRITGFNGFMRDIHRSQWKCGEWTDDSDQAICIMESMVINSTVNLHDIAKRLHTWGAQDGKGIGLHTYTLLCHNGYLSDPIRISNRAWVESNCNSAPNGAIMRTAPVGIWQYEEPETVAKNADFIAQLTHYDPRCRYSSVLISSLIAGCLRGDNSKVIINKILNDYRNHHPDICRYTKLGLEGELHQLNLDGTNTPDEPSIGYTLKTLAAGLYAYNQSHSFEEGLLNIINEGGDADTNGCVAGALLGAKYGLNSIPEKWINSILNRDKVIKLTNSFIETLPKACTFSLQDYETESVRLTELSGRSPPKKIPPPIEGNKELPSITVMSESRIANMDIRDYAVISIGNPGSKRFFALPKNSLILNFSDIDEFGKEIGWLRSASIQYLWDGKNNFVKSLCKGYWSQIAKQAKYRDVVPYLPQHAQELRSFVAGLTDNIKGIIVHCEFGKSRSPAVAMLLNRFFGYQVIFKEESIKPNSWVINNGL